MCCCHASRVWPTGRRNGVNLETDLRSETHLCLSLSTRMDLVIEQMKWRSILGDLLIVSLMLQRCHSFTALLTICSAEAEKGKKLPVPEDNYISLKSRILKKEVCGEKKKKASDPCLNSVAHGGGAEKYRGVKQPWGKWGAAIKDRCKSHSQESLTGSKEIGMSSETNLQSEISILPEFNYSNGPCYSSSAVLTTCSANAEQGKMLCFPDEMDISLKSRKNVAVLFPRFVD
ncbi:hypothetical protein MKW98_014375 [Papaver atlanticum]|uniref:Uncharacterized protein n=1 Tax=Papaver atlanticum TaxID=357466 RepID=A0AAD4SPC6_9MAGN|nr:hypothetical protein MKW98_014375 [Papaver atlanticum]